MILLIRWLYRRYRAQRSEPQPELTSHARAAHKGTLQLVLHQSRYDLVAFMRNKQARFFTLLLPLAFLVILVGVFGNRTVGPQDVKESTYFIPGISALAVISASFVNLVISIVTQREAGGLKRRRATPVPASVLIAGRTLTAMAVSLVVMTVVLATGRLAYGVHLPVVAIPAVALTAVFGSITFCILGYALSTVIGSADAAQPIVQAVVLPLYFISGVFVPGVELPSWLRRIAEVFPVERLADGLHKTFSSAPHAFTMAWSDLGVLAIWIAAGLVLALRRFKWTPNAASV